MRHHPWIFLALIFLAAGEEFRVEGIIHDRNPKRSVAVINGDVYQAGDKLGDFKIVEVGAHAVKIQDMRGQEHVLKVKAGVPTPANQASPLTVMERAKEYLANPGKAVNRAWEMKALRDLAIINNASVKYFEKNGFFPSRLHQLTLGGFLPASYETGNVGKYRFYLSNKPQHPDDFQLHADPADPKSGLRYFFVGPDAKIREALERPATGKSPEHHYLGKPE